MAEATTSLFKPGDRVYFTGWKSPHPGVGPDEPAEWATVTDYPTGDPDRVSVVYDGQPGVFPAAVQYLVSAADAPIPDPKAVVDLAERVAADVRAERARQDAKWGEQNHPDGTGLPQYEIAAERAKRETDRLAQNGKLTWTEILREEFLEALAESNPAKLRTELVQVAAVAQQWAEAIDRRTS